MHPTSHLHPLIDSELNSIPSAPALADNDWRQRLRRSLVDINAGNFNFNLLIATFFSIVLNLIVAYFTNWFGAETHWEKFASFFFGVCISGSLWLTCAYLNAWLSSTVDWLGQPWKSFAITLLANTVAVISMRYLIDILLAPLLFEITFVQAATRFRFGDYMISLLIALFITAIYQGAYFLSIWKASLLHAEQLKSANLRAKYEVLNAQVNPHFLFNSLNVLSALVHRDPHQAEDFIQGLSDVYRYVLEVKGETMVTLARELEALDAYAKLLMKRFGEERLHILIEVPKDSQQLVVPLALQMLLENAVKHNGATRQHPLTISVTLDDKQLVVSNNIVPLYESVPSNGLGLNNIRERYLLATGKEPTVIQTATTYSVRLAL